MSLAQNLRSLIPLIIGLAVGGAGVAMFREIMPGAAGTAEERAEKLEVELKRAQNRVAALEAAGQQGRSRAENIKRSLGDGARSIVQDIRDGRPVSPEDIFRASKPLMRDLAPLFDRLRVKEQRNWIDSMSGELARKYNLTAENQTALKQWFDAKSRDEAKRWSEMLGRDETRLEDVVEASRRVHTDEGLEDFMGGILTGDKLATFYAAGTLLSLAELPAEIARAVPRAFYFWLTVGGLVALWLVFGLRGIRRAMARDVLAEPAAGPAVATR